MFEPMKQTLFTALGAISYTTEQLQKNAAKLMQQSGVSNVDAKAFIEELQKKSEEAKVHIASMVKDFTHKTINSLQLPTREEFEALKKRVAALEKEQENS